MLNNKNISTIRVNEDFQPTMCIIVGTEEEFDWSKPFSRLETSTVASKEQYRAHDIYAKHDARPTYVMDYCILDQTSSATIFKDLYDQTLCEIGTHLHT